MVGFEGVGAVGVVGWGRGGGCRRGRVVGFGGMEVVGVVRVGMNGFVVVGGGYEGG